VRLRDTDRDGYADLFVAASSGALRLPGSAAGVTTNGLTELPWQWEVVDGFLE
jgi:hypothetical protein